MAEFNMKAFVQEWTTLSPAAAREKLNNLILKTEAPEYQVASTQETIIHNESRITPLRLYKPKAERPFPIILLIHGGGWYAGNLDTHDNLARYLCSKAGALVVSVGYTNVPDAQFPVPMEQCYDALLLTIAHAQELSADAQSLAVVGDSAGGNMSAALCLMARDRKGPHISLQVLINPAPDLTCGGTFEYEGGTFLDLMRYQAKLYVASPEEARNVYVSPLHAENLSNLPPAIVLLAAKDHLLEDGQMLVAKLQKAGVAVTTFCQPHVGHLGAHGARATNTALPSLEFAVLQITKAFTQKD